MHHIYHLIKNLGFHLVNQPESATECLGHDKNGDNSPFKRPITISQIFKGVKGISAKISRNFIKNMAE